MSEASMQDGEEHIRKRRRLDTELPGRGSDDRDHGVPATVQLLQEQYTVGWICALPVELAAAKAMLDIDHIQPQASVNHYNVYAVGSMCGHNVVIACLPDGSYGTTSAAVVAEQMMCDFTSIKIPLMVGIGGGVPDPNLDVRLGDVVVSTSTAESPAVVQHDFGKTGQNGTLVPKGTLNKPKTFLSRAATNMKATPRVEQSRVPEHISEALKRLSPVEAKYAYPGSEHDTLYELMCDPNRDFCNSSICAGERLSQRNTRSHLNPVIHYGTIASGNQVMKDAHTRNRVAKDSKAICFDMEAAGVMDEHQCLVIRGICDYSDRHKDKRFQGYAALAAAAVAKELLSMIPAKHVATISNEKRADSLVLDRRALIMEALDFEESDSRRATVSKPYKETCKWLLEKQEYLDWLNLDLFEEHQGLLWIKGKPGTGKSTIMKFLLEEISKQKSSSSIVVSFFFNARANHDLEKSTIGMYRSLIHQLLHAMPALQPVLDDVNLDTISAGRFTMELLQSLFMSVVELMASKNLICIVDALDECPEDQIRSMIDFFADLGDVASSSQATFNVLFSSRHYPNIMIERGQTMILEDQSGHSQDIVKYVNAKLKIGKSKQAEVLKEKIQSKSRGIFLWVVLVVPILKKHHDQGRVRDLEKKLQEIPMELDDLFRDIILRDGERLPDLVLCMQWLLFSARPLMREELYFALLAGSNSEVPSWDPDIETSAVMDSFILDTSKGLAEMNRSKKPTAQFIHESVREFLLKPGVLAGLYHEFEGISNRSSHQCLRECCIRQIRSESLVKLDLPDKLPKAKSEDAESLRKKAQSLFPFLQYAVENAPYHAEHAESALTSHVQYMRNLLRSPWIKLHNTFQKHDTRRLEFSDGEEEKLLSYLATRNLPQILIAFLSSWSSSLAEVKVQLVATLLLKANKFEAFVQLLKAYGAYTNAAEFKDTAVVLPPLGTDSPSESSIEINASDQNMMLSASFAWYMSTSKVAFDLFLRSTAMPQYETAIANACKKIISHDHDLYSVDAAILREASSSILQILLAHGADANARDRGGKPLLHDSDIDKTRILLAYGADVNAQGGSFGNALQATAAFGLRPGPIVKMLIDAGADVNAQGGYYGNALQAAATNGRDSIVKMLIDAGADVNAQGGYYGNALQAAATNGHDSIVKMLIEARADVNAQGGYYGNALQAAAAELSSDSVIKILIDAGADVNAQGGHYGNALQVAVARNSNSVIKILIDAGADVNAQGGHYGTALQAAAGHGRDPVVKMLIEARADVNAQGGKYGSAIRIATTREHDSIVKMLMDAGAEAISSLISPAISDK